ncbi:MAG: hemerythrin domain-containing protein [Arenicellales bacterium]
MKSLSIIRNEHRNLAAVLFSMEKLIDEIESGKQPEFKVFHGLLTYIDRFLEQYHHPKEDKYLFPVLMQRCPEITAVLEERAQEHRDGQQWLFQVLKALSAYESLGDGERAGFAGTLRRYIDFERNHAISEEKRILPLAREKLLPADWDHIDAAFTKNQDPLFGDARRAGFEELYSTITAMVPPPYGLGSDWR